MDQNHNGSLQRISFRISDFLPVTQFSAAMKLCCEIKIEKWLAQIWA